MWKGWYVRHLIKRIRAACIIQRGWYEHKVGTNNISTILPVAFDAILTIYWYLNDISIPEVEIESDGDSIISRNGGDSGDDAPTLMEYLRGGILADTSGVEVFGGSGLNDENVTLLIGDENTVQLLIGDKFNLNLPIEPEPHNINIINTENEISVSNTEVKIDAATRMQCLFRGYRSRQWMVHKIAADKCRNATDPDFIMIYKAMRKDKKTARWNIARHIISGSGRNYHKAVSEMKSSVITIQFYARMYMARRRVRSMRGGVYHRRRTNGTGNHGSNYNCVIDHAHTPVIPPVPSYTVPGTRRIHSQASGFSHASLRITLKNYKSLPKHAGENGEREYDAKYDAGDTCANVFALSALVYLLFQHKLDQYRYDIAALFFPAICNPSA